MMKKDRREAKKRYRMQEQARTGVHLPTSTPPEGSGLGGEDNSMKCILYLHGGGYFFGSVNQTRHSTTRFARKIKGRAFSINYRLAPQYPFPCALQDALAAYLFLIRPPPGSHHEAIKPAHIIFSGDSVGAALALALLQVLRDTGLPLPAGGVLISPWCDLTHSFPSIHENAKRDFIPESGLLLHKPSLLWPPPSSEISKSVYASLRSCTKHVFGSDDSARIINSVEDVEQLQCYTVNDLLRHPLVSPVTGYLGGLPPLLFIAGDAEVLRDEIIYTAHKAAYPEKYPDPRSSHIQDVGKRPTSVHLQVYDEAPHILPVLFPFTKPSKFCFRAMANFARFVTDPKTPTANANQRSSSPITSSMSRELQMESYENGSRILDDPPFVLSPTTTCVPTQASPSGRTLSQQAALRQSHILLPQKLRENLFPSRSDPSHGKQAPKRMAGEPQVYEAIKDRFHWDCRMIRERVSTSGITRELEPEDDLAACKMPDDRVGRLSKKIVQPYITRKQRLDLQFSRTIEAIEKDRRQLNPRVIKGVSVSGCSSSLEIAGIRGKEDRGRARVGYSARKFRWVLDESENPPPSSIAARRDIKEARHIAAVAAHWVTQADQ